MAADLSPAPRTARLPIRPLALAWLLVVAAAIALRLVLWWVQARSGAVQPGDPEEYYRAALHILQGGYHDTGKWLRPPLYPLFLALAFGIFGVEPSRALLLQAVLTGAGVPLFGMLARQLFGRRDAALAAGVLAALFVPLASFGSVLFAEAQFVLLIVLGLALLIKSGDTGRVRDAALCGIVFGLAALTRAMALSFLGIAALYLAIGVLRGGRQRWRDAVAATLALLLGAVLVIAPWTARNYAVHQRLIAVDTNGGISMWYGVVRSDAEQHAGEQQLWAMPNLADRQAQALRWTLERIREDPLWFAGRMRFKIASLYLLQVRSFAVGDVITISPQDEYVALGAGENTLFWSILADGQYILITLLAIATLCFAGQRRRLAPVVAWVLFATFMSAITIGHPRLRLPIVAALIPLAAYALVRLRDAWRQRAGLLRRHAGRLAVMMLGWALFAALIVSTRYLVWARGEQYAIPARQALATGDVERARELFEQARAADPGNALRSLALADLAFRGGQYERALAEYGAATAIEDRNLYAHAMRERTAALLGRRDLAAAEQAALAGYGRDNNEVAWWAWHTFDDPPRDEVVPGDALALGQYEGFTPATPDLAQGRWTMGAGRVRVRGGCGDLVLRVRGPAGRALQVSVEHGPGPQSFVLTGQEQDIRFSLAELPACAASPEMIVRLHSATSLLDIEQAPWMGGVALLRVGVEGR